MAKKKVSAPFEFKPFSPKALAVIEDPLDAQITVLEGSVRSSKTISSIVKWGEYVASQPKHARFLMLGVTQDTLYRNVISDLIDIFGAANAEYIEGELRLFGRLVYCVGAHDKGAEKRIRGMTVWGCYVDEVTQIPMEVVRQSILRCSAGRGRIMWTTNPDSPYHPIFVEYIGNETKIKSGMVKVFHFTMADNLALSEEYKANVAAQFVGLWYKRMVLGLWVLAEGVIYDGFDLEGPMGFDDADAPASFETYHLTLDYGTQNAFVALLVGVRGDEAWYLREYYYSGRDEMHQKTDAEYREALVEWLGDIVPSKIIIDPSAASFKAELRRAGFKGLTDADNDVTEGIKTTAGRLRSGKVRIHRTKCPGTAREMGLYSWDKRAAERGEDKPLKQHDHGPDAIRYREHTMHGKAPRKARASEGV